MMRRFLLAALALVAASTGSAAAADKVRFVQSSWGFLFVPAMVADALGIFEQEGVQAEFTTNLGGAEALAAVIGGNADIYIGAPSTAMRSREKGTDVVVFAPSMTQYASNVVVSKNWAEQKGLTPASTYEQRLQALRGATIGVVGIGSGTHQLVMFLAKQAGLNHERDLTVNNLVNAQTQLAALQQGRSDGFVFSSPTSDLAVKQQGAFMLFYTTGGEVKPLDGFLYIGFIARQPWLEKNPDLAVRILRGVQKSLDVLHDPEATKKARDVIHAKYHPNVDKALWDEVWANTLPAFPKTVMVDETMMKRVQAFVNEFEKKPLPLEFALKGYVDTYAEKALASLK